MAESLVLGGIWRGGPTEVGALGRQRLLATTESSGDTECDLRRDADDWPRWQCSESWASPSRGVPVRRRRGRLGPLLLTPTWAELTRPRGVRSRSVSKATPSL